MIFKCSVWINLYSQITTGMSWFDTFTLKVKSRSELGRNLFVSQASLFIFLNQNQSELVYFIIFFPFVLLSLVGTYSLHYPDIRSIFYMMIFYVMCIMIRLLPQHKICCKWMLPKTKIRKLGNYDAKHLEYWLDVMA